MKKKGGFTWYVTCTVYLKLKYLSNRFAASHLMYYTQKGMKYEQTKSYMEAARKGRSQQDCKSLYLCNNEIPHH